MKCGGSESAHSIWSLVVIMARVDGTTQHEVETRRPRSRARSGSPKSGRGTQNLKRTMVKERMRGMVQTCHTVRFWEKRNPPSKNEGRIYLKENPEEKLLGPKRVDHKND